MEKVEIKRNKHIWIPWLPVWLTMTVGTCFMFYICYDKSILAEISWIRSSVLLATCTLGWSVAACYIRGRWPFFERPYVSESWESNLIATISYILLLTPFTVIMIMPTHDDFGKAASENARMFVVSVALLHGLGFWIIGRTQNRFVELMQEKMEELLYGQKPENEQEKKEEFLFDLKAKDEKDNK